MNILIVTSNRCGSISLSNWLKSELSDQDPYTNKSESYEIINDFDKLYNSNTTADLFDNLSNKIVVLLFDDYKTIIQKENFLPEEKFDFTICLKRNNFKLQSESYVFNLNRKDKNKPYSIPDEWLSSNSKDIEKFENKFKNDYDEMLNIFGYHAVYESVFDENSPEDLWNIASYIGIRPAFYWKIKSTFKLRRFGKINLI